MIRDGFIHNSHRLRFSSSRKNQTMTIKAILDELHKMSEELESGSLETDDVMKMTELTRQLHERMIVIQYKAFEATVQTDRRKAEVAESETDAQVKYAPPADADAEEDVKEPNSGARALEELEVSPNQISLIDSIEEISEMEQSLNETFQGEHSRTLAQKFNKKPITDLKSAITINQKFLFISRLFNDDKDAFEMAVKKINTFTSYLEADDYVQNNLKRQFDWEMKNPTVKEMMELIERRFL